MLEGLRFRHQARKLCLCWEEAFKVAGSTSPEFLDVRDFWLRVPASSSLTAAVSAHFLEIFGQLP